MTRQVAESPVTQGPYEQIAYSFDWSAIGTPDSAGTVKIYDKTGTDTSGTNLTGSASLTGNIVTTPIVKSLTARGKYKLVSSVTISSNTLTAYLEIDVDWR